ncbi:hypothetical protein H7I93_03065 [Mycobacterium nebraskense]|jgi:hypothetical protein|uniref:hypothetical protein n=1 Tax=Mycobacterium nebraskense TaxID=244292 RepID=UPI00142D618B|nr:hypothetical protein [Mycobacterium nebraskense]MCV7116264.1 hypothetical protein [Mycobacterium nebraskense]
MVEPWIVEAVLLVAGAQPARLARWMRENVDEDARGESRRGVERVDTGHFVL